MIYFVHRHIKIRAVRTRPEPLMFVLQGRESGCRAAARAISIGEHHTSLFTRITMLLEFSARQHQLWDVRYVANLRETFMTEHPLLTTANRSLLLNSLKSASLSVCSPASSKNQPTKRRRAPPRHRSMQSANIPQQRRSNSCLIGCGSLRSS
jgi:hypothetical protein